MLGIQAFALAFILALFPFTWMISQMHSISFEYHFDQNNDHDKFLQARTWVYETYVKFDDVDACNEKILNLCANDIQDKAVHLVGKNSHFIL